MNILMLCDKPTSAIDRLCNSIKNNLPHLNITIQALHPKRPSVEQISESLELWNKSDVVVVAYWKSGEKFKELYPEEFKNKLKILWHHNPYDIGERAWTEEYQKVVVHNDSIQSVLPYARNIPQGIDLDFFEFNNDYTDEKTVQMVVGRIEGKKGVREVARACYDLDYKFVLVGRISNKDYFDEIVKANPKMQFRENITDEKLKESYYESAIHVCNSIDNFESGTMPILEAMACGVPVLTRNVGHVPDMYDGSNMIVRGGETEDLEDLKKELKDLMENEALRRKMREKAYKTITRRSAKLMAIRWEKLIYSMTREPLVSIILPFRNNLEVLEKNLTCISKSDYKKFELIVVDSSNYGNEVKEILDTFKDMTVKYVKMEANYYCLAEARNRGIVESCGNYLMFVDERIGIEPTAISEFIKYRNGNWQFGIKDGYSKEFVENFSFVPRGIVVKYGMFNERVNVYGGMSEEIRKRFGGNGVIFERVVSAKADALSGTSRKSKKDKREAKLLIDKLYR